MMQDEKDKLIAFFDDECKWCQGIDAMDQDGQAVHYDDEKAASWDLVGGLCHLFGWQRASRLFEPISRHFTRQRHLSSPTQDVEIAAMSALCDFNDADETTHELLMSRLRDLPVWHGRRASL
jgi:hypothetical protein